MNSTSSSTSTVVGWSDCNVSTQGSSPLIVHGLVQVILFPQFGDDVGDSSGCDWRRIG